jgi:hypothetical protein
MKPVYVGKAEDSLGGHPIREKLKIPFHLSI